MKSLLKQFPLFLVAALTILLVGCSGSKGAGFGGGSSSSGSGSDPGSGSGSGSSATTFSIGGTVTGLAGTGLILQDNGTDNLAITGNGSFTFKTAIASGV